VRNASIIVHDTKLPDRIEVYEILPASVRRYDETAFVCDCLMPDDVQGVAVRHYSFPDRWWAANVSLDLDGSLRTEFGPGAAFAYDCDITTPHFEAFGALCNIDLKLDVFLRMDGRDHIVTDHEDFTRCVSDGSIDDHDRMGAERGLAELLDLIERRRFVPFLEDICGFDRVDDAAEVNILGVRSLADVPVLARWRELRDAHAEA
jgi:hypothetical protein